MRPPLCAISYAGGIKTIFCASINNIDTANKARKTLTIGQRTASWLPRSSMHSSMK